MIAIFLRDLSGARELAHHFFGDNRPRTDGPFRVLYGDKGRTELRLYVVETGAGAYAAARLAARRGATKLIPVATAAVEEEVAEQERIETGTLLPVNAIWDLAVLEQAMRLLPDSAETFAVDVKKLLPKKPLWKTKAEGYACGTLPFPLRSSLLAQCLYEQHHIALADEHLAGYAKGAADAKVDLHPYAFCPTLLNESDEGAKATLEKGKQLETAFGELLSTL